MRNLFVSMYVIVQTLFFVAWLFNYRPAWDLYTVLMPTWIAAGLILLVALPFLLVVTALWFFAGRKDKDKKELH